MSEDSERETKPFKFVTGKPRAPAAKPTSLRPLIVTSMLTLHSGYALLLSIVQDFRNCLSVLWISLIVSLSGFDARFPNQNQTKHCWQNYVDYHKCILAKGEDFAPCRQVRFSIEYVCLQYWLRFSSFWPIDPYARVVGARDGMINAVWQFYNSSLPPTNFTISRKWHLSRPPRSMKGSPRGYVYHNMMEENASTKALYRSRYWY